MQAAELMIYAGNLPCKTRMEKGLESVEGMQDVRSPRPLIIASLESLSPTVCVDPEFAGRRLASTSLTGWHLPRAGSLCKCNDTKPAHGPGMMAGNVLIRDGRRAVPGPAQASAVVSCCRALSLEGLVT
jgi:hypothetical protein